MASSGLASGLAGEWFISEWCAHCERDKCQNGSVPMDDCGPDDLCQILGRTMFLDVDDPDYPREWIDDPEIGPRCTAFIEVGQPLPPARDTQTIDMFEMPDQGEE
ncbi:hypothetical protein [Chromobacterium violaceum]|uniref:hypothetical protein n=1 Tax=Chromobacterium violaceum TaxID=536 RepID=UPI0005BBABEC|nr:hypothetical protein [Chromobacterium violaceum]